MNFFGTLKVEDFFFNGTKTKRLNVYKDQKKNP